MNEKETQQSTGVVSDLNNELGLNKKLALLYTLKQLIIDVENSDEIYTFEVELNNHFDRHEESGRIITTKAKRKDFKIFVDFKT